MPKVAGPSGRLVEVVPVDFEANGEPWTTYKLSDGSVLKMRVTLKSVARLEGEFGIDGNPAYALSTDVVSRVVSAKIRGDPTIIQKQTAKPARDPSVG